jgi:hypothetical protein
MLLHKLKGICQYIVSYLGRLLILINSRATAFFRIFAAIYIAELIGSPVSAALMDKNTWLPMFLGLGCLLLSFVITAISKFSPPTFSNTNMAFGLCNTWIYHV